MTIPTIGRIVLYKVPAHVAADINRRRQHARANLAKHVDDALGVQLHMGNDVQEGDVFPMVITKVWNPVEGAAVNGQVMLDGNDLFWASSVTCGDQTGQYTWPTTDAAA